jgi:addiction module RelB/DinJ family antitoxin
MEDFAMPANSIVRARIDEQTRNEAAAVLKAMGLTVSDAFRVMMVKIPQGEGAPVRSDGAQCGNHRRDEGRAARRPCDRRRSCSRSSERSPLVSLAAVKLAFPLLARARADCSFVMRPYASGERLQAPKIGRAACAKAHARQMNPATRTRWGYELGRNQSANLDAPNWLRSSIVELVASHEAARYAIDPSQPHDDTNRNAHRILYIRN